MGTPVDRVIAEELKKPAQPAPQPGLAGLATKKVQSGTTIKMSGDPNKKYDGQPHPNKAGWWWSEKTNSYTQRRPVGAAQ